MSDDSYALDYNEHRTNAEFRARVAANTPEGRDLVAGDAELGFSWLPCELCDSGLGGDRHEVFAIKPGTRARPERFRVCVDCLVYVANGDLPHEEDENAEG